jgi:hypothetical protein
VSRECAKKGAAKKAVASPSSGTTSWRTFTLTTLLLPTVFSLVRFFWDSCGPLFFAESRDSVNRRTKVEAPHYRSKNTAVVRGAMVKVPVGALYWLCFTTRSAMEFLKTGCNSRGVWVLPSGRGVIVHHVHDNPESD